MIVLSDSQYYSDIANAIRAKNGESTHYKPSEMALAIKSLQGGGINCTLTIFTVPNATVTATFENQTITAIADVSGAAVLELSKEGVWTVTATYEGETVSTQVDTSLSLETELQFKKPLAECTWEEISAVSKSGKASKWWSVGDTRPIVISGVTYTAQIMDFDMYDVSDPASYGREKAGVVFQLVELIDSAQNWSNAKTHANSKITNESECKDFVPMVVYPRLAAYNATQVSTGTAKGFLASEQEIFGANSKFENPAVGTQFAFYKAGNSPIKKVVGSTSAVAYWTRSHRSNYSTTSVIVNTDGTISAKAIGSAVNYTPIFCL